MTNSDYLFDGQFPISYYLLLLTMFIIIAYVVSHDLFKTNRMCDIYTTGLCDYYYDKYKTKCRYRMSHNVFCLREVIKNGV